MKRFLISAELTSGEALMTNTEFRRAMDVLDATLDEMAVRLGVARRLIADYRKEKRIPPSVAFSARYLLFLAAAPRAAVRLRRLVEPTGIISHY